MGSRPLRHRGEMGVCGLKSRGILAEVKIPIGVNEEPCTSGGIKVLPTEKNERVLELEWVEFTSMGVQAEPLLPVASIRELVIYIDGK